MSATWQPISSVSMIKLHLLAVKYSLQIFPKYIIIKCVGGCASNLKLLSGDRKLIMASELTAFDDPIALPIT